MRNLTKFALVFSTIFGLSLAAPKSHADTYQTEDPCGNYAAKAVYQFRNQQLARCGLSGTRWNENGAGQHSWCRTVRPLMTENETKARATELLRCLNPQASINAGDMGLPVATLNSELASALGRGALERAQQLIAAGADVKTNGEELMRSALSNNQLNAASLLKRLGIPLNTPKYNPLIESVSYYTYDAESMKNNLKTLEWLLKNGVNPNLAATTTTPSYNALATAINENNEKAVTLLLRYKANPNLDTYGKKCTTTSPLDLAVDKGNTAIIAQLRRAGAKPQSQCKP